MRIHGKVVVITGASAGIGAACASEFRRRGARLSLVARSEDKLRQVAREGDLFVAADLTQPEARRQAVELTLERFGSIDILINNAGVGLYAPSWQASESDARHLFDLNFFVPLAMIRLVVPHMRERRSGVIVNVGSIAGKMTLPWFTLYSASKYALGSLTDGLRMELRSDGIHAITVCPGYVKTDFQKNVLGGRPPERVVQARRFTITADTCARAIADGVERSARTVVTPWAGWVLIALQRLLPRVFDARLAAMNRQS